MKEHQQNSSGTLLPQHHHLRKIYRYLHRRRQRNNIRVNRLCVDNQSPIEVIKEYSRQTTLHGMRYITREDALLWDRLCWLLVILLSGACALGLVWVIWIRYRLSPTVTTVESTFYPLYKVGFPAVTICNSNNINRAVGEEILLRHLNQTSTGNMGDQLRHVLSLLAKFHHPYYEETRQHFQEARRILPLFDNLNISDFMLQVMPSCEEVFKRCLWQGQIFNCCERFDLQRFEGGFCYSFNSLTSETKSHCVSRHAFREMQMQGYETGNLGPECIVLRNAGSGLASGLEVYLRHQDISSLLQKRQGLGFQVLIHHPTDFPELGRGMFLPTHTESKTNGAVKVVPSTVETSSDVRDLSPAARECYFSDEHELKVNAEYTHLSCLLECRMAHIMQICGCLPYYFSIIADDVPICSITQLTCILDHQMSLRVFKSPPKTEGLNVTYGMNCLDCLPTCHDNSYVITTSVTVSQTKDDEHSAYLDVYYDGYGAVKYQRKMAVNTIDLLVSIGGIAGLFLGVSLLSGIEFLYFAIRVLKAIYTQIQQSINHPDSKVWHINVEPYPFTGKKFIGLPSRVKHFP